MSCPFKAVTILILVLFNIVSASFPPLPNSKYTELNVYASDSERPSDDNESRDGIESLSSDEDDFGNDYYDFINGNDYDSNNVEEYADSRNSNENLIVPFEPVKFFDDSEENSHSIFIKSDDNTESEEFNMMPISDNNNINTEEIPTEVVNDSVQIKVIKPKKFTCDCTRNCADCCNIS